MKYRINLGSKHKEFSCYLDDLTETEAKKVATLLLKEGIDLNVSIHGVTEKASTIWNIN